MIFEPSEHEPEEYDPEAELEDPDADGLTIPSVNHGGDPVVDMDASDVSRSVVQTFWTLVITINAAVLFVSLGAMLLVIQGMVTRGSLLILGGLVLFGLAHRRYRRFEAAEDEADSTSDVSDPDSDEADVSAPTDTLDDPDAPDSEASLATESDTVAGERGDPPE